MDCRVRHARYPDQSPGMTLIDPGTGKDYLSKKSGRITLHKSNIN